MAREIEMAYKSDNNPISSTEQRTRLVGVSRPDVDELLFSAFAHQRLRGGSAESDTSIISYYGDRDPEDRRVLNLMRRETRRLQALDPAAVPGESYVLCPDIARLKFSYYDIRKKEWRDDWDSRVAGTGYLPVHVRIVLTVIDEYGKEVAYSTDARINLTETVAYR
jgi:general secretion pathway protein J